MAKRNSWFTELEDCDFPIRYVSLPEGNSLLGARHLNHPKISKRHGWEIINMWILPASPSQKIARNLFFHRGVLHKKRKPHHDVFFTNVRTSQRKTIQPIPSSQCQMDSLWNCFPGISGDFTFSSLSSNLAPLEDDNAAFWPKSCSYMLCWLT